MNDYAIANAVAGGSAARAVTPVTPLSGDVALALWEREGGGKMPYPRPDHHKLSVYVAGGAGVRHRLGRARRGGGHPGAICVIPEGEATEWENSGYVSMLHIYFRHGDLERLFERPTHAPKPLTFGDDPLLAAITRGVLLPLDWSEQANRLALDHAALAMLSRLDTAPGAAADEEGINSRLDVTTLARIRDYIEHSLAAPLRVADLAAQAHLGARQFTRAFTATMGMPPHAYVLARRIARARHALARGDSIASVSAACGFSSQSHFSRRFRASTGVSPSQWQRHR